jgi:general secretion pathway protein A
MRSIESEPTHSSHLTGLSDPRFFYGNLYIEVLAALRFGIQARKGLILFTGDVGTGKTAVLHELKRELNSKTPCILVSDPNMRFVEVLRLILRALEPEIEVDDERALIRYCQTALRSHTKNNRIVSLAFDDAQNLPDNVIKSLTKHFLGKGFDPDDNLLQIVLAGRPELRKRLFMPPLRALETQVEVECRLRPLEDKELDLYVKHRLGLAAVPAELFDHDALERIAVYSGGRPGPAGAICDRALELAHRADLGKITPDLIDDAARDVDLETPNVSAKNIKPRDEAVRVRSTTVVAQPFVDLNEGKNRRPWFSPAGGSRRVLFVLWALGLVAVSAAWFQGDFAMSYLREWGIRLDEAVASKRQIVARAKTQADKPPVPQDSGPVSNTDVPVAPSDKPESSNRSAKQTEKSANLPASVPVEQSSAGNPELSPANRDRQESPRRAEPQRRDLAKQISKAIENRAILGIHVSVSEGIAYLDGTVATSAQRDAAEQAARSVPEVREIRNRIAIE